MLSGMLPVMTHKIRIRLGGSYLLHSIFEGEHILGAAPKEARGSRVFFYGP